MELERILADADGLRNLKLGELRGKTRILAEEVACDFREKTEIASRLTKRTSLLYLVRLSSRLNRRKKKEREILRKVEKLVLVCAGFGRQQKVVTEGPARDSGKRRPREPFSKGHGVAPGEKTMEALEKQVLQYSKKMALMPTLRANESTTKTCVPLYNRSYSYVGSDAPEVLGDVLATEANMGNAERAEETILGEMFAYSMAFRLIDTALNDATPRREKIELIIRAEEKVRRSSGCDRSVWGPLRVVSGLEDKRKGISDQIRFFREEARKEGLDITKSPVGMDEREEHIYDSLLHTCLRVNDTISALMQEFEDAGIWSRERSPPSKLMELLGNAENYVLELPNVGELREAGRNARKVALLLCHPVAELAYEEYRLGMKGRAEALVGRLAPEEREEVARLLRAKASMESGKPYGELPPVKFPDSAYKKREPRMSILAKKAVSELESGRRSEAEEALRAARRRSPVTRNIPALVELGRAEARFGNIKKAADIFKAVEKRIGKPYFPERRESRVALATAQVGAGLFSDALDNLSRLRDEPIVGIEDPFFAPFAKCCRVITTELEGSKPSMEEARALFNSHPKREMLRALSLCFTLREYTHGTWEKGHGKGNYAEMMKTLQRIYMSRHDE